MTERRTILAAGLAFVIAAALPGALPAQSAEGTPPAPGLEILDAAGLTLDDFLWLRRPVVVFADTPADPRFAEQLRMLTDRPADLIERDVVVITDTDPDARSAVRLKLRPRGFALVVLDKNGTVVQRKPSPWSAREISNAIDKLPLRQDEIRERKQQTAGEAG
jgi:hypothetical protein